MRETVYRYDNKTPAEITDMEKAELEELHKKNINELSYEEMGRIRRLLFRKNLPSETLKDHVDVLFSATNFEQKPSTFTESFYFSDDKKYGTLHPDMEHHFKKNFMLTFAVEKDKQKYIIRK